MKALLLYKDRSFDPKEPLPLNVEDLVKDLELNVVFKAMSDGDDFLFDTAKHVILTGSTSREVIQYRQEILKDCLKNVNTIRQIYQLPLQSIENKKKSWLSIFTRYPGGILASAIRLMKMQLTLLKRLKKIADVNAQDFKSEGFTRFFKMIQSELDDDYFSKMEAHLKNLEFRSGTMISANLGRGNEGFGYILRLPKIEKGVWLRRLFRKAKDEYSFSISPRDESGSRMLSDLRDRGINLAANAIAQSAEHIDSFIDMLQHELGFYIGCLNLSDHLDHLECPKIFPSMENKEVRTHSFHGLYDVCLALTMKQNIVGNTIEAVAKDLFIISGANQGGKSTFLRSIGVAQMMMQSGMFVGANQFKANICQAVFTHFKRKEDATMESGKLDEELTRMSEIVDAIIPNSLMLFNESFTTTNEREGSEIAYQITKALQVKKIKVFFVTHMYEFAHSYYAKNLKSAIFLQAERKSSGKRTFRLKVSEPTQTSFGVDVYNEVFGFSTEKNS